MFFKRLSRSRQNSYNQDDDYDQQRSQHPNNPQSPDESYAADPNLPPSSYKNNYGSPEVGSQRMYSRNSAQDSGYGSNGANSTPLTQNNSRETPLRGTSSRDGYVDVQPMSPSAAKSVKPAPDLLTLAFNEAIRPHTEKIDNLEQQVADLQGWINELEAQRQDIFAWIDKRGLRPDVPPSIATHMDKTPDAAPLLNGQLDRKITIVNFDLHRLQDDLNDSISSAHFASSMTKFLPDIRRLASLPTGPRYAYELLIKLVGNLNSHGGMDAGGSPAHGTGVDPAELEEDRRARANFYDRIDGEMVDVIRRRVSEGEDWQVGREVKRLEKTAGYLKSIGIEPYFPHSLDLMRREGDGRGGATSNGNGGGYGGGVADLARRYS